MDSLLCEEQWSPSPMSTPSCYLNYHEAQHGFVESHDDASMFRTIEEDDLDHALSSYLDKEVGYMPKPGYVDHLRSKNLLFPRFRAVRWIIKSRSRLELSCATVFNAINCLDLFLSTNQCQEWKHWMVELLSVACLAVASKFNETHTPSFHEIQLEDLDHSFQPATIQRMELIVLETIGWRLSSPTAYSYVELLITKINSKSHLHNHKGLLARVTELLFSAMLDCQLVEEYQPSIVAVSALLCTLQELVPSKSDADHLTHIMAFINQDQKDSLMKCCKILEGRLMVDDPLCKLMLACSSYSPSSPVTVLLTTEERIGIHDSQVDLSPLKMSMSDESNTTPPESSNNKKRKLRQ